jgi:putative FmdB family regulatory protein
VIPRIKRGSSKSYRVAALGLANGPERTLPGPRNQLRRRGKHRRPICEVANSGSGLDTGQNWIHLDRVWSNQRLIMTYDYVCTACAHAWEAQQRITEDALRECPQCHELTAKRQVSGGQGFILKGGGWYSDLYSSAKSGAEKSEAHLSGNPSKTKSEEKPATTTKPETTASPCASGACGTSACPAAPAN